MWTGADESVKLLLHVLELAGERVDPLDLVAGGPPLPAHQGAVEQFGVLTDPLLSGDRAALLRGDDFLLQVVELRGERSERPPEAVLLGKGLRPRKSRFAREFDPVHERAHVAEEGVDAHDRVELFLALRQAIGRTPVEADLELRLDHLRALREAHGVRARHDARALRRGEGDLRRTRDTRRLHAHRPRDAVQPAPLRGGNRVHELALGVEHLEPDRTVHVTRASWARTRRAE